MHLTSPARGLSHPLFSLKIPSGWPVAAPAPPHSSLPPCSDLGLLLPTLLNYLMSQFAWCYSLTHSCPIGISPYSPI